MQLTLDTAEKEGSVSSKPEVASSPGKLTELQRQYVLKRLNSDGLCDIDNLPRGIAFLIEMIETTLAYDSTIILEKFMDEHCGDPNIPNQDFILHEALLQDKGSKEHNISAWEKNDDVHTVWDWDLQVRVEASLIAHHSPYPEVRAVCEPYDDVLIPCETVRVYILGIFWCGVGVFINTFFHDRQPKIDLDPAVVQLLLYPSGLFLQTVLPDRSITIRSTTISLNPGPWTYKEQMLATIFYSVLSGISYVAYMITAQKLERFYGNHWINYGYELLLILSTNFIGFGLAGIMRKFAVYPTRSIWPTILPTLALNKAIMQPEKREIINGWSISRYSFMVVVALSSFFYFWIPEYFFRALSVFSWLSWIKPDNYNLTAVTGSLTGLGINPVPTFDWNVLNHNGALTVPFFNLVSLYVGMLIGAVCILVSFYTNYKWTRYLPINSPELHDNKGRRYRVREILDDKSLFDKDKYEAIGPPFYSAGSLVIYGSYLALYPFGFLYQVCTDCGVMRTALQQLWRGIIDSKRSNYSGYDDAHCRMMAKYKEVPEFVFLIVLLTALMCSLLCVKLYPIEAPVWTVFFAIGINFLFLVPLTALYLVTGFSFGLNVLVQIIIGYACPGNGLALMFVKAIGVNVDSQAQNYISDQKMGHYLKIPPRALFRCQMFLVLMTLLLQLVVLNYLFSAVDDYCAVDNKQKFTCPSTNVFFSALVVWGVIGPRKVFGALYPQLRWCALVGAVMVVPCLMIRHWLPRRYKRYFQPILVLGGFHHFAPYNLLYHTGGLYLLYALMHFLKKRYTAWWEKYNYVFSGAMSAGVAFSSIVIFFSVQLHDRSILWWGNNVVHQGWEARLTGQWNATERAPDGYFGPRKGSFPEN